MKPFISVFFCFSVAISMSQNDGWRISTTSNIDYTGIVVANGRIGILPSEKLFKTKSIILNNVYDKESPLGVSRILLGMNFGNLNLEIDDEKVTEDNISNWSQTLNMKKAYFKKAKEFHPDVNKSEGAKEKFASINEAYEVLGDDSKKRVYD